jgi:hypothetical protein
VTTALRQGIVDNAADAARVEDAYRLTAEVLLQDDSRVQAAYRTFEQHVETTDPRLYGSLLCVELAGLVTLVHELGLSQYRWLPGALFWQFCRVSGTDPINVELPKDLVAELDRGRAPKRGDKQREDLERNIRWWYRARVKGESKRGLQRAAGIASWNTIQKGIQRAETLLACIDVPPSASPVSPSPLSK